MLFHLIDPVPINAAINNYLERGQDQSFPQNRN